MGAKKTNQPPGQQTSAIASPESMQMKELGQHHDPMSHLEVPYGHSAADNDHPPPVLSARWKSSSDCWSSSADMSRRAEQMRPALKRTNDNIEHRGSMAKMDQGKVSLIGSIQCAQQKHMRVKLEDYHLNCRLLKCDVLSGSWGSASCKPSGVTPELHAFDQDMFGMGLMQATDLDFNCALGIVITKALTTDLNSPWNFAYL